MTAKDDGGPAFPFPSSFEERHAEGVWYSGHEGMSLRDWFAGKSLQSAIAEVKLTIKNMTDAERGKLGTSGRVKACATLAYEMADAMLKERKR